MNTVNKALMHNFLALSVQNGSKFQFSSASVYAPTSGYIPGTDVTHFSIETEHATDAIFFNLTPEYEYLESYVAIEDQAQEFTCQCFSDGNLLVATVQSDTCDLPLGFLGIHPRNHKRFPQAGYLALAFIKEKLRHQPAILRNTERSLFKAIGEVCFPTSKAPTQQAEKVYLKDLSKHAKKGSFPLKGAPIQQGHLFFMNGEYYVFTPYGVAKVIEDFYGELVVDVAISIEANAGCHIIRIESHCLSQKPGKAIVTLDDIQEGELPDSKNIAEIPNTLNEMCSGSLDFDVCVTLSVAVLSNIYFDQPDLDYVDRWNKAACLFKAAFDPIDKGLFELTEIHP